MGQNLFSNQFGNGHSLEVVATPPEGIPNMAASNNVSQIHPPFQPYISMPPFREGSFFHDDSDIGCEDEKNKFDRVYGPSSISEEIEEYQIFKSKKDLNTNLSLILMQEKFSFKIFKSNTHFVVALCLDMTCPWRVRANRLDNNGY